jgi:hypothetical protein
MWLLFIILFRGYSAALANNVITKKSNFETGFDEWSVENSSWARVSWQELKINFSQLPLPPNVQKKVWYLKK